MPNSFRIGKVEIKNRVVTAPLAGISNPAFRGVLKSFDPGLMYTEMTSDKALIFKNKKTWDMLEVKESENPVSLQLFGGDPKEMGQAAKIVSENSKTAIIDVNMGCPMPKIWRNGSGSHLMRDIDLAASIIKEMKANTDKPVTAKIRMGWDMEHVNAVEMAIALEKAGADAIAVHGRTKGQLYQGKANWDIIKQVKQAVSIPVIGNGDINSIYDAKRMIDETGCDAIMIGRGMLGNPWLIKQCVAYLEDGTILPEPTYKEKFEICRKQALALIEEYGEESGIKMMRSHACWYIKGLPNSNLVKDAICRVKDYATLENILCEYEKSLDDIITTK